jgi:hypothetical protein
MWRVSWSVAALTTFLATQTWLAYAADGSLQGAKALFYTETGTTVAPKTDDRGPTTSPLQLHRDRVGTENVSRASNRPKASMSGAGVSKEPWLGIAYWVEWERPGAAPSRIADPSRFVFRSGDRIRFHVKTNVPGYLYVVNRGSSGRDTMLFPYVGMPDRLNRVEGQKEYAIPPRGWIMFDNQAGEETLLFAVSPRALSNLLEASLPGSSLSPPAAARLIDAVDRRGAKDLLVETDDTPGQQATYLGAAMRSISTEAEEATVVTYRIRLQHQ